MNKSILILYTGDDWSKSAPEHSDSQKFGYHQWGEICKSKGVDLLRAGIDWFSKDSANKYWRYNDGKWDKIEDSIKPTVIYDKTMLCDPNTGRYRSEVADKLNEIDRYTRIVNNPNFAILLDNKLNMALIFGDRMPDTKHARAGTNIENPNNDKIVLKECFGSGGSRVRITNDPLIPVEHNSVVQKFIDGSIDNELKDLRIVFIGDEPVYALSRTAKKDSLHTNLHQGATIQFIDLDDIKEEINDAKKIGERLNTFSKRIFSVDYLKEANTNKLYLMEINTMPGIDAFSEETKDILHNFLERLTTYILDES